jgi:hypothetical protein
MSTKIAEYKTLLAHITIAQNVQFHHDAARQIDALASQVNGILPAFETYRLDANVLDAEFDRKSKSVETDELALKDDRRDATTVQIISRIEYHSKFPQNDTEKEAVRILQFIADAYREAPHKNYQAETSYLRNMIAELRKNEAGLELFELTTLTNRLDRENTEFETLHTSRTNAKEARRESGTLGKLSGKANESFDVLCRIANGMLLMTLDDVTKSALGQIASLLNAQIHQYDVNYRQHAGVVAGKKKANEKNIEE